VGADHASSIGGPLEQMIVDHRQLAVGGQVHVALDQVAAGVDR